MFSIINRVLSLAITSFGEKFCLKKRSRLIKVLNNRFHVKFMQLEIGLLRPRLQKANCLSQKNVKSILFTFVSQFGANFEIKFLIVY